MRPKAHFNQTAGPTNLESDHTYSLNCSSYVQPPPSASLGIEDLSYLCTSIEIHTFAGKMTRVRRLARKPIFLYVPDQTTALLHPNRQGPK